MTTFGTIGSELRRRFTDGIDIDVPPLSYAALLARFGGLRLGRDETRQRILYYVHRSELARIASTFYHYAEADRRLR
jgi:hypothetical protein